MGIGTSYVPSSSCLFYTQHLGEQLGSMKVPSFLACCRPGASYDCRHLYSRPPTSNCKPAGTKAALGLILKDLIELVTHCLCHVTAFQPEERLLFFLQLHHFSCTELQIAVGCIFFRFLIIHYMLLNFFQCKWLRPFSLCSQRVAAASMTSM